MTTYNQSYSGQEGDYVKVLDLNQEPSEYRLFTAKNGNVRVNNLIVLCPDSDCNGKVKSISVITDTKTPQVFIDKTRGNVKNLTAENEIIGDGNITLKDGKSIVLILEGGPSQPEYLLEVHVSAKAITKGAELF